MNNLLDLLYSRAGQGQPAVYLYENFYNVRALTYSDLIKGARAVAAELAARNFSGLPLPIVATSNSDFIFGFFGIIMSGNIPVPIAPSELIAKAEYVPRIKGISQSLGHPIILGDDPLLRSLKYETLSLRGIQNKSGESSEVFTEIKPAASCLIQFSSGSTQEPRGVVLTHEQVLANLKQIAQGMRVTPRDILASWLPLYHDMGLIGGLLASLYNGVPLHLSGPADFVAAPGRWLQFVGKVKATIIMGPDFSYRMYAKKVTPSQRAGINLTRVRLALSGAEPVSAQTCRHFIQTFREAGLRETALFPVYGLAENTLGVTFSTLGKKLRIEKVDYEALFGGQVKDAQGSVKSIELVSCGKPLEGIEVRIQDREESPTAFFLGEKKVGRILIKSPSATKGYYKNKDATKDLYFQDWLVTGDLGFIWDGELFVVGREKDLIKVNGKSYYSPDIERKAAELSGFKMGRVAAFSAVDLKEDREVVQIVVESQEIFASQRQKMKRQIASLLSDILFVDIENIHVLPPCSIPRTSSGKTKRFELRRLWQNEGFNQFEEHFLMKLFSHRLRVLKLSLQYLTKAFFIGARSLRKKPKRVNTISLHDQVAQRLSRVLSDISGLDQKLISPQKTFQDYKLDSLGLVTLTSKLNEELAEIPLTTFIEHNTIHNLSHYLVTRHPQESKKWVEGKNLG